MTITPTISYPAAASDVTLRFGSAVVMGRTVSAQISDPKPNVSSVGPDGEPVKQVYVDSKGKVVDRSDLGKRMKVAKDEYIDVTPSILAEAKESDLPKNMVTLTAYKPSDIDSQFVSEGKLYLFDTAKKDSKGNPVKPDPANEQWCDFLYAIVEKGDVVLLGTALMSRNDEAPYRLVIHRGNLALEKLSFPTMLREFESRPVKLTADVKKKAYAAAKSAIKEFNPLDFPDNHLHNLLQIRDGKFQSSAKTEATASGIDLAQALDDFTV